MTRLTITLEWAEREALIALGMRERRDPRAQAALVLCERLRAEGLLPDDTQKNSPIAFSLPARAMSEARPPTNEIHPQENYAKHTSPATN